MITGLYAERATLAAVNFQHVSARHARGNTLSARLGVSGYVYYGQATVNEYDVQREFHVDHGERVIGIAPQDKQHA